MSGVATSSGAAGSLTGMDGRPQHLAHLALAWGVVGIPSSSSFCSLSSEQQRQQYRKKQVWQSIRGRRLNWCIASHRIDRLRAAQESGGTWKLTWILDVGVDFGGGGAAMESRRAGGLGYDFVYQLTGRWGARVTGVTGVTGDSGGARHCDYRSTYPG